jgi:outer membrane protein OmpA-like peptidoglycan-associated protein
MKRILITTAMVATLLSGCVSTEDPNRGVKSGAVIGGIAGAVLSNQTNSKNGSIIGGVLGAGVGALIGKDRDAQQRKLEESLVAERAADQVRIDRIDSETIRLVVDSSVTFGVDSAAIRPGFRQSLNKIANSLREYPNTLVQIVGHTDNTGSDSYNQVLSERRAESVGQYFGQSGISYNRLITEGRGERQPIASNASEYGRAQNRRVEIYLKTPQG